MLKPFRADRTEPLLALLIRRFPEATRTRLKQTLEHGSVRVNGRIVTLHRHAVEAGDAVDFLNQGQAKAKRFESRQKFTIIREDAHILVVEKPEGLLTMATEEERAKTLYAQLTEYVRLAAGRHGRVFIVHRLDRETSGLLVFAKTEKAKHALQGNWDQVVKKYTAVTEGIPRPAEGTIRGFLREDKSRRMWTSKHAVKDSKPASTSYRTVKTQGRYAFLEVTLETGRKNQIRAHLAGIGAPVAGDRKYGAETDPLRRLALHATELSFPHPETGERLTFRSRPPAGFSYIPSEDK